MYRDPSSPPVVSCLGNVLFAVDAESGDKRWSRALDKPVRRIVMAWRHVFVATHGPEAASTSEIVWFDVHTGEKRGSIDAGFAITAALARGTHVYFAGPGAAVGMSADGTELFRIELEARPGGGGGGGGHDVVGRDGGGRELWRVPALKPGDGVLLVGDAVAQPDIDT